MWSGVYSVKVFMLSCVQNKCIIYCVDMGIIILLACQNQNCTRMHARACAHTGMYTQLSNTTQCNRNCTLSVIVLTVNRSSSTPALGTNMSPTKSLSPLSRSTEESQKPYNRPHQKQSLLSMTGRRHSKMCPSTENCTVQCNLLWDCLNI